MKNNVQNIDAYIAQFPGDIQKILETIRSAIHNAAPEAKETIKYAMPTFTLNGNLIHFAAYQHHIGIYPSPKGNESFQKAISIYKNEKSTLRFPLDKPLPLELIKKIIKLRISEASGRK